MYPVTGLRADTGADIYNVLLPLLRDCGQKVAPRGKMTAEILGMRIVINQPENAVPIGTGRKMKLPIGATEYMHLLGGISSLSQLNAASANRFTQFADGPRLLGAYGPRGRGQLARVVQQLTHDLYSRQAHVLLLRPADMVVPSNDVPCTMVLSFFLRDSKLQMFTHMRSNDAWLGFPYDVWMFTRLQMTLAYVLGAECGEYTHSADSMHLYETDFEKIDDIKMPVNVSSQPPALVVPGLSWAGHTRLAREICLQPHVEYTDVIREAIRFYAFHVPRIPANEHVCEGCGYVLDERFLSEGAMRLCDDCQA